METNFEFLVSLWRNYNNASSLFTKAIGGTANEVGEFAEILVANYYGGEQLQASNKSADIKTKDGKFIQVKSRKIEKITTTSLNVIRSWDFDLLVVVLFSKEGNVLKAIEIDSETAEKLSTRNDHQNGNVLTTNNELLNNKNAKDITIHLQKLLDSKQTTTLNFLSSNDVEIKNQKQENSNIVNTILFSPPTIEFYPENINIFKKELLRVKKAKRTWFHSNGSNKSEIWNASNFTESSDIKANIKTNSTYRKWKELGIVKVKLEIL